MAVIKTIVIAIQKLNKVLNILKCSGLYMSYVNSQVKITYYRRSH